MGYNCDSDDGNAASILVSILEAGDIMAFCGECFPRWVIGAAKSFAEADLAATDDDNPAGPLPVAVGAWAEEANDDTDPPTPALPIEVGRPTDSEPWGDPPVPDMVPPDPPKVRARPRTKPAASTT